MRLSMALGAKLIDDEVVREKKTAADCLKRE
jgi:hypothetical protein